MKNENDRFWTAKDCFQYLDIHLPCYHGTRIVFSALREVVSTYLMKTILSMNMQACSTRTCATIVCAYCTLCKQKHVVQQYSYPSLQLIFLNIYCDKLLWYFRDVVVCITTWKGTLLSHGDLSCQNPSSSARTYFHYLSERTRGHHPPAKSQLTTG